MYKGQRKTNHRREMDNRYYKKKIMYSIFLRLRKPRHFLSRTLLNKNEPLGLKLMCPEEENYYE